MSKLKKASSNEQVKNDADIEKLYWAPIDAFKFAHDFKIKYDGKLTDELIESLLFEVAIILNIIILIMNTISQLNKIWANKEDKAIQRLKELHTKDIAHLKRRSSSLNKYEDVWAKRAYTRIRDQLKKSTSKLDTSRKKYNI